MNTMTKEARERLQSLPRTQCSVCKTSRSYSNPMAKCFNCKEKFCYDHIYGSWVVGAGEITDICEACTKTAKGRFL